MLGLLRRRAISGALVVVAAGSFLFVTATSASATPVVVAPLIPEAAATVGEAVAAGCAATGPGCAIVGAAALAYGAWWAYTNRDLLLPWLDSTVGAPVTSQAPGSSGGTWVAPYVPAAGSGPFTHVNGDQILAIQCQGGSCVPAHMMVRCMDTGGQLSMSGLYSGYANQGDVWNVGNGLCLAPAEVTEVTVTWGSSGAYWYWKASGSWDSTRTTTTTIDCTVPGGATTTYNSTVTQSNVTQNRTTTIPNCSSQGAPAGSYVSRVVVSDGAGGSSLPVVPRVNWQVNSSAESTYPNCFTGTSPGLGGCALAVTWNGTACDTTVSQCVDWYTQSAFSSAGYGCMWGPYVIPLSSCTILRYSYQAGTSIDPKTGIPTPAAAPSASPTTQPQAQPTMGPNPQPTSAATLAPWTQAPNPFPTDGSTPTATPNPQPPPSGQNCMESGWSWNPVSWVYVPVRCVLIWAFVPDSAAVSQVQSQASSAWSSSGPGLWTAAAFTALGPLGNIGSSESGTYACGIPVHFPFYSGHSIDFVMLNSCVPPLDTLAPIVKGFLTAVIIVNGLWLSLRILGAAFGWQLPSIGRGASE